MKKQEKEQLRSVVDVRIVLRFLRETKHIYKCESPDWNRGVRDALEWAMGGHVSELDDLLPEVKSKVNDRVSA